MPDFLSPKGKSQQCHLLLNMMILQSVGDVSGRMLAPTSKYLVLFLHCLRHPALQFLKFDRLWSMLTGGGLHSFQPCWLEKLLQVEKGIKGMGYRQFAFANL